MRARRRRCELLTTLPIASLPKSEMTHPQDTFSDTASETADSAVGLFSLPETPKALIATPCRPDDKHPEAEWIKIAPTRRQSVLRFAHAYVNDLILIGVCFALAIPDIVQKAHDVSAVQIKEYGLFIACLFGGAAALAIFHALLRSWRQKKVIYVNAQEKKIVLSRFFKPKKAVNLSELTLFLSDKTFVVPKLSIEIPNGRRYRAILETFCDAREIEAVFRGLQALGAKGAQETEANRDAALTEDGAADGRNA